WRAHLVAHNPQRLALARPADHGLDEIRFLLPAAGVSIQPARPDEVMALVERLHHNLAGGLRYAVDGLWREDVFLRIGCTADAVEDVVRGEGNQQRTALPGRQSQVPQAVDIDLESPLHLRFAVVHTVKGGAVD